MNRWLGAIIFLSKRSSRRARSKFSFRTAPREREANTEFCLHAGLVNVGGSGPVLVPFSPHAIFVNLNGFVWFIPGFRISEARVAAIPYIQVRKGMVIVEEGQLQYVVDRELNTPGNWRAILHIRLKNLKTGNIVTRRVQPDDKVEQAFLEKRNMQYIYQDGDGYVFMDVETFDQITLSKEWVGDWMMYMKEGDPAVVIMHDEKPLSLDLPVQVALTVAETVPSVRGATAANQHKAATLETGLVVQVPPTINVGERILVDTRTGEYLSRAS
jgi:elongation factor P